MNLRLMVSDPWDFKGPDGPNTINARYLQRGKRENGEWIICTCNQVTMKGVTFKSLLLLNRHKKESLSELGEEKPIAYNACWRKDGEDWDEIAAEDAEKDPSVIGGFLSVTARVIKR